MANLKLLRKRITSIASTKKITKAMQLVAANKLAKASQMLSENDNILDVANNILLQTLPLLTNAAPHEAKDLKIAILITSDKGLCGSYNAGIVKFFNCQIAQIKQENLLTFVIGKKGRDLLHNTQMSDFYYNSFEDYIEISQQLSSKIVEFVTTKGAVVEIYFNDFKNTISYVNSSKVLWPLSENNKQEICHLQELDPEQILKMYFSVNLLSALLSSNASELSARMVAMDNATRNATTLIDKLTLNLNRSRQAMVTKELIEIISGAEAL